MITLYNKSCERMRELADGSVDLCITSPPYLERDGFSYHLMSNFANEVIRVLKDGGLFFLNFGDTAEEPGRQYKVWERACAEGFSFVQEITWLKSFGGKGRFAPLNGNRFLNRMHEPLFVFCNGEDWKLDRLSIGEPYSDPTNSTRFKHGRTVRCAGDVWFIPYANKTHRKDIHPHGFPDELVRRAILLSGIAPGSSVLDPFTGGGTTLRVAQEMGHNGVGYELSLGWYTKLLQQFNLEGQAA